MPIFGGKENKEIDSKPEWGLCKSDKFWGTGSRQGRSSTNGAAFSFRKFPPSKKKSRI
jgi:hypothetical protein